MVFMDSAEPIYWGMASKVPDKAGLSRKKRPSRMCSLEMGKTTRRLLAI